MGSATDTSREASAGRLGIRGFIGRPLPVLRGLRRADLWPDLQAGMTVAAVLIPQGIAYAAIAELPPQVGIYTAVVAAIVGSLWGSSPLLATGPTNATSLLTLAVLMPIFAVGSAEFVVAAAALALLAGVVRIVLSLARFGALVTIASRSVLLGFTLGAGVLIATGQLRHLLNLRIEATPVFHHNLMAIASGLGATHTPSLAVGFGTLILLLLLRRLGPRLPAALLALMAAAAAVAILDLDSAGVQVVGDIPRSLPPFSLAPLAMLGDLELVGQLIIGATAVAALGLVEAIAIAQTIARSAGHRIDNDQEIFGQGIANLAVGLFSGYPCSGSFTRSALAHQVGGRSHLAGISTGLVVLVAALALAPYARFIPRAGLAGIILVVAYQMVDRWSIRRVMHASRTETLILWATFLSTLTLPLEFAVLAGVMLSLAIFVIQSSLPGVYPVVPDANYRHFEDAAGRPTCPQLGVMSIRGPLFFGAVYHVEQQLRHNLEENPGQNTLLLRMHGVDLCDISGVEMLEATLDSYRGHGGDVYMVRPREQVLRIWKQSDFLETLGEDHILPQEGAIEHLFDHVVDPMVCIYECEHRVFAECQALEKHPYPVELAPALTHCVEAHRGVDVERARELIDAGQALILDVREPEEFERGHLPAARLLPLRLLLDQAGVLPRRRTILLVCRSGRRSLRALHMLRGLGFESLHNLEGGILSWRAEGLPVGMGHAREARLGSGGGGRARAE